MKINPIQNYSVSQTPNAKVNTFISNYKATDSITFGANNIKQELSPLEEHGLGVAKKLMKMQRSSSLTRKNISQYLTNHQNHLIFQDYLLNDWGIIHLHINPIGKRHPATDGILLFVLVRENKAFFINIGNHNSFLDIELLRIIEKNWHNILDCYTVNGITPENLSSKEMLDLRKNNIIYTINVNNKCYTTQLNHSLKLPFSLVALKKYLMT